MPPRRTTPTGYARARTLRQKLTPLEYKLWSRLRNNQLDGVSFRRQHAIGPYIVDFCTIRQGLIIELDGSQHLEQTQYDKERSKYLESEGYKVLRFWNDQVANEIDGVIDVIMEALDPYPLLPPPNPTRQI